MIIVAWTKVFIELGPQALVHYVFWGRNSHYLYRCDFIEVFMSQYFISLTSEILGALCTVSQALRYLLVRAMTCRLNHVVDSANAITNNTTQIVLRAASFDVDKSIFLDMLFGRTLIIL